jgi:predicted nucleic acid-binding protein
MILVDTSVWIDFFRGIENEAVHAFHRIIQEQIHYGITSLIYQEVLQGAQNKADFNQLANHLETQLFYHPVDPVSTSRRAARIYQECRLKGITISSTIDCLIAQIALEHGLYLLHHDKDYVRIAEHVPELRLFEEAL